MDSLDELCRRSQKGDVTAASELLTLHYEKIFGYFRRLCHNEADACDLTQKTFCKVWQTLAGFKRRSSFSTWIHGIAHHVYVDWRRTKSHVEPQPEEWWLTCVAKGPSPFDDAAERETAHQLYALVEQMDEAARETIHLHYYQGLTIQETADALGVATSTVKYRVRNALEFIKSRLLQGQR